MTRYCGEIRQVAGTTGGGFVAMANEDRFGNLSVPIGGLVRVATEIPVLQIGDTTLKKVRLCMGEVAPYLRVGDRACVFAFGHLLRKQIIIGVKSAAAYGIVRVWRHDHKTGLTIASALAQIGEFSFILIVMGVQLDIVPTEARDLVVAGALVSILLNPVLFRLLDRTGNKADEQIDALGDMPAAEPVVEGAPKLT